MRFCMQTSAYCYHNSMDKVPGVSLCHWKLLSVVYPNCLIHKWVNTWLKWRSWCWVLWKSDQLFLFKEPLNNQIWLQKICGMWYVLYPSSIPCANWIYYSSWFLSVFMSLTFCPFFSNSSTRTGAVSCTWEGTLPCTSTGLRWTYWRAALWRRTWVFWWMTSWAWASSVPWLPQGQWYPGVH